MADKKAESKIVLEREYNVPLRRKYLLVPKYKRTNKAVKTLREFIAKHMKSDDIKLGRYLNDMIWKDGAKKPPHHVEVIAKKDDQGVVFVEMKGAPVKKKKEESKKDDKKSEVKEAKETSAKETKPEVKEAEVVEEKKETKKEETPKPTPKPESKPTIKPVEKKE